LHGGVSPICAAVRPFSAGRRSRVSGPPCAPSPPGGVPAYPGRRAPLLRRAAFPRIRAAVRPMSPAIALSIRVMRRC